MTGKIVDEDWKKRAQAEKEALAAKYKPDAAKTVGSAPAKAHPGFPKLLQQLATQALFHLGLVDDGSGMAHPPNFEHARIMIEQIEMLEAKTKGNLTREEEQALKDTMQDVRMAFVEMSRRQGADHA